MENKELFSKIKNIDNLSNSQKDRVSMYELIQCELVDFLQNQIHKINTKSELRSLVVNKIIERIDDEGQPISTNALLSLLDILSKDESMSVSSILGILKEQQKVTVNIDTTNREKKELELSAEEVQSARKILGVLDLAKSIKETEYSLDELSEKNKEKD